MNVSKGQAHIYTTIRYGERRNDIDHEDVFDLSHSALVRRYNNPPEAQTTKLFAELLPSHKDVLLYVLSSYLNKIKKG